MNLVNFSVLILIVLLSTNYAQASFWTDIQTNVKNSLKPSEFVCTKYERQEFEKMILRPGVKLPFTEVRPRKKVCIEWEEAPRSAIGRVCKKYRYENTDPAEESKLYQKVKRYRTVCVDGYTTR